MLRVIVGLLLLTWIVGLVLKLAVEIVWGVVFLLAVALGLFEWLRSRNKTA